MSDLTPAELKRITTQFPNRIPVFVSRAVNAPSTVPEINKKKFLAPSDLQFSEFIHIIRKRIALQPEQALFFFIDNLIPNSNHTLLELYSMHKQSDGSMRITYTCENTFGC
jgi:GABA(A) receptor-associated protein